MNLLRNYIFPIIATVVLCTPIALYLFHFYQPNFSNSFSDWEKFATYLGGTIGTLGSVIVGYFIYLTLRIQNKQRIEQTLFNYLNSFSGGKNSKQQELISKESDFFQSIKQLQTDQMKDPYFEMLKTYFIESIV